MIRRKGYAVAIAIAPLAVGVVSFLVGRTLYRLMAPLGLSRGLTFVVDVTFAVLVCHAIEYLALHLMVRALGNRSDIPAPHVKRPLDFRNRSGLSNLDEALHCASAFPAALTAVICLGSGLSNFPGPELAREAAVIIVMLSLLVLAVAYAIMISGWRRCKELLDTKP